MTNSSLSSVRSRIFLGLALVLAGCAPDDGSRDLALGRSAYEAHDLKKAERCFEKSLQRAPTNVETLVCLAQVKLDLGELGAAQELVVKASVREPDAVDIALLRAQIEYHAKDFEAAARDFNAIADDAALPATLRAQGLVGLGIVEMSRNNHHLARLAFLRAIRMDRREASAWYHLGLLYGDAFGYAEAALEQFEVFVRLDEVASPRVQRVQHSVIPALRDSITRAMTDRPGVDKRNSSTSADALAKAEAAWKKGAFKTARQHYEAAFKADPLSYPAALGLAKAWEKTDSSKAGLNNALANYKLACTLRPSAISTFVTAGALALKLNMAGQAEMFYSRAVAANPNSLDALDGLIRALRKAGAKNNIAQAYQAYRDSIAAARKKK